MTSHFNLILAVAEPYLLVMEYVMYGKLLTHLREQRSKQTSLFHFTEEDLQTPSEESTITAKDLTKYAYGVAKGMEYITSKQVTIHSTNFETRIRPK